MITLYNINEEKMMTVAEITAAQSFAGMKILLYGDLGSGKTFFVRHFIKALSKNSDITVSSPTFPVQRIYDTTPRTSHIDLYRIADPDEIEYLDIFSDDSMIYLIEWAQYLDYLIPKEYLKIHIDYTDKIELRNISIFSDSEKYSRIIKSIDEWRKNNENRNSGT